MDYMIDIETLGTKPGSIIASIGVVEFDAREGYLNRKMLWALQIEPQVERGFVMEVGTVLWWMKQSTEAKLSTFYPEVAWSLEAALHELDQFIARGVSGKQYTVWANSPTFDLAHLEHAYAVHEMEHPWTYKQPRDCRTLFDATDFNYSNWSVGRGVAHDALEDARVQALAVIEAFKGIRRDV